MERAVAEIRGDTASRGERRPGAVVLPARRAAQSRRQAEERHSGRCDAGGTDRRHAGGHRRHAQVSGK